MGELRFRKPGLWEGLIEIEGEAEKVAIALPGNDSSPGQNERETLLNFVDRYDSQRSAIAPVLFELYRRHLASLIPVEMAPEFPRLVEPEGVWEAYSLIAIGVENKSEITLTYCIAQSHDDTLFSLRVRGDSVTGEIYGD